MSFTTNPLVLFMRSFARRFGVNRLIAPFIYGSGYETRYDNAFQELLIEGDCVWDVGANIGYYTTLFARKVGESGSVFAFEPSPDNFLRLTTSCAGFKNVRLLPFGLGQKNAQVSFVQGTDELGATSHVVDGLASDDTKVDLKSAFSVISEDLAKKPCAIKIDVEGFEYEVLLGLSNELYNSGLRLIGIEMHFSVLESRGMKNAPIEIEKLLFNSGFKISWPDSSHLLARRI